MPKANTTKPAFRLTPKHLLITAFIVVIAAIAALIVGVFQTLNKPALPAAAQPNNGSNTVEIWSPRGANAPATAGVTPPVPGSNTPSATPYPTAQESHAATAANTPAQETAVAPSRRTPPRTATPAPATVAGETPVLPRQSAPAQAAPAPAQTAPAPRAAEPAPQAAPKPAAPKSQPKDVMDNLF